MFSVRALNYMIWFGIVIPNSRMDMVCFPSKAIFDRSEYVFDPLAPSTEQQQIFARLEQSAPIKQEIMSQHPRKGDYDEICLKRDGLTPRAAGLLRLALLADVPALPGSVNAE